MTMELLDQPQGPEGRVLHETQAALWISVLGLLNYHTLGRCFQPPQTWWLKTTEKDHSTVLAAQSLKSRCWQTPGVTLPCLLKLLGAPGAPGLWLHHSDLCLHLHMALFSVFSLSLFHLRTLITGLRPNLEMSFSNLIW